MFLVGPHVWPVVTQTEPCRVQPVTGRLPSITVPAWPISASPLRGLTPPATWYTRGCRKNVVLSGRSETAWTRSLPGATSMPVHVVAADDVPANGTAANAAVQSTPPSA